MNYITPEMASDYNSKAEPPMDVWTIGVMLYVMHFTFFPFKDEKWGTLEENVINSEVVFPESATITPKFADFIRCCLVKSPGDRISPSAMLIHDWMLLSDDAIEDAMEAKLPLSEDLTMSKKPSILKCKHMKSFAMCCTPKVAVKVKESVQKELYGNRLSFK